VRRTPFQQQGQVFLAVRCKPKGVRPADELGRNSAVAAAVFNTKQKINMSIDELMATLAAAKQKLGGEAQVVRYDDGHHRLMNVVRIEDSSIQTAIIEDLGNGVAAWTLNEERPGAKVLCLLLD
jgi:hypothetical protein